MGEIAEDFYTGHCCMACMQYFKEAHSYPVLCKECWREEKDEWPETQKAHLPEI